ncbi:hypothetical protein KKC1_31740 [Calderihabitans maritimus]|uniref:Uncharacterized protein n=2 Tax=Calderihabitans maritimus TaxID=1246530 RepID=A0A1Z5HX02_9FIRM|nr:hypothetical protein KKC1_31740 [Calderihabitans maritimus]
MSLILKSMGIPSLYRADNDTLPCSGEEEQVKNRLKALGYLE